MTRERKGVIMRERRRNLHGRVHEGNGAGEQRGTIFVYSPYSGTHHFNQCDLPFLSPIGSTLNCEKAHQVNMDICLAFLARHLLKGTLAVVNFFLYNCMLE